MRDLLALEDATPDPVARDVSETEETLDLPDFAAFDPREAKPLIVSSIRAASDLQSARYASRSFAFSLVSLRFVRTRLNNAFR